MDFTLPEARFPEETFPLALDAAAEALEQGALRMRAGNRSFRIDLPARDAFLTALVDHGARLRELHLTQVAVERVADWRMEAWCGPNLERLYLDQCKLGDEGASVLASALHRCTNLHRLALPYNAIGDNGVRALASVLPQCPHFQSLDLSDNNIRADGILALAAGLEKCATLDSLNFSCNSLHAERGSALGSLLERCSSLRTVDLLRCAFDETGVKSLAQWLHKNPTLQRLNLSELRGVDRKSEIAELASGLACCSNIQELHLGGYLYCEHAKNLLSALASKGSAQLRKLCLRGTRLGGVGAKALARLLQSCTNLEVLDLSGDAWDETSARALRASLVGSINVKCVDLAFNEYQRVCDGPSAFWGILASCAHLQELNLVRAVPGPLGAKVLAPVLEKCIQLQVLDVSSNSLGCEGAKALALALEKCTLLERVNLAENAVRGEGVAALASALGECPSLRRLGLNDNKLGSRGVTSVASSLGMWPLLAWLSLADTGVDDQSATALAVGLVKCTNLEELDLRGSNMEKAGMQALGRALGSLPRLRFLDLTWCTLGEDGAMALAALLPELGASPMCMALEGSISTAPDKVALALAEGLTRRGGRKSIKLKFNRVSFGARGTAALASALPCLHPDSSVRIDSFADDWSRRCWRRAVSVALGRRAVAAFLAGAASPDSQGAAAHRLVRNDGDGAVLRRVLGMLVGG